MPTTRGQMSHDSRSLLCSVALTALLLLLANVGTGLGDLAAQPRLVKAADTPRKDDSGSVKKTSAAEERTSAPVAVSGVTYKSGNDTGGAAESPNSSGGGSSNTNPSAKAVGPGTGEKPMTQRALCVLVVVSAAVIVYFVIRTVRMRRKNKKTRRYGVLDTNIENMELTPLEQDDDEDDTLFDASHPRRLASR